MSKSSRGWPFGGGSGGDRGAVTVVEISIARSAARRARIAFWVFALGSVAAGLIVGLFDPAHQTVDALLGLIIGAASGLAAGVVMRVWPVVRLMWHWSLELVFTAAVVVGFTALADAASPLVALLVLLALAAVAAAVGPSRRWVVMVAWCMIVRHRLRMCFAEFIRTPTRTNPGSLPLILFARPTPAGERVWLWLRPGLDLSDLEGRFGKLAVACWANEVRIVQASTRFAALLRVDVARRDPLAARIDSPLPGMVPPDFAATDWTSAAGAPVALDLADVPDSAGTEPAPGRPVRPSRAAASDRKNTDVSVDNEYDAFI